MAILHLANNELSTLVNGSRFELELVSSTAELIEHKRRNEFV